MKIQNLIRRKSGSNTSFGGEAYAFTEENDHTVDVTNEEDIARFLAIPTYRAVDGEVVEAPEPKEPKAPRAPRAKKDKAAG